MFKKKKKAACEPKKETKENHTQSFTVSDRRFWLQEGDDAEPAAKTAPLTPRLPSYVETLKQAAEKSEERARLSFARIKEVERETDEIRQRLQRDIERRVELKEQDVFREFVEILDNLERSLAAASESIKEGAFFGGIDLIYNQIKTLLEKHGIKKLSLVGKKFDPKLAEAIDLIPTHDPQKDGDVVDEIASGYLHKNNLLRPAKVRVATFAPRSPSEQ